MPTNSWLNVSGFAQAVTGGHYYWLVLSSKSNSTFSPREADELLRLARACLHGWGTIVGCARGGSYGSELRALSV